MTHTDVANNRITAVLVQTHQLTRSALRCLLETRGIRVLAEAGTIADAHAIIRRTAPDMVLSDVELAGTSIVPLLPALRAASPRTRVMILTSTRDVRLHAGALDAGATGVVLMEHSTDALINAIETVHRGGRWFEWGATRRMPTPMPRRHVDLDPELIKIRSLTRRERELVGLVGEGLKNQHIAQRLCISQATVRNHLTSILGKLDLSDRFELAVYAFRHGLVTYPQPGQPAAPVPMFA